MPTDVKPARLEPYTRVRHRRYGLATVQPLVDFYGNKERTNLYNDLDIIFIKLDVVPEGYAETISVDGDSLTAV